MQTLGKTIERTRKLRGWSAETVAGKTNGIVSLSTMRRIEDDDPKVRPEKIAVVCHVLGLNYSIDTREIVGQNSGAMPVFGELVSLPPDLVRSLRAMAAADGVVFEEWLSDRISELLDTDNDAAATPHLPRRRTQAEAPAMRQAARKKRGEPG